MGNLPPPGCVTYAMLPSPCSLQSRAVALSLTGGAWVEVPIGSPAWGLAHRSHCGLTKLLPLTRTSQGKEQVSSCSLAYSPAGLAPPLWFLLLGKGWGGGFGDTVEAPPRARGPALRTGPDPWSPPGGVAGRNLGPRHPCSLTPSLPAPAWTWSLGC